MQPLPENMRKGQLATHFMKQIPKPKTIPEKKTADQYFLGVKDHFRILA